MTKSNLFLVVAIIILLFAGFLEATETNLENSFIRSVDPPRYTGRPIPPSGPNPAEPPVRTRGNINVWSPSQRLVFGILPKNVLIPLMGPSRKESPWAPPAPPKTRI
ncbi:hypothetical protein Bca4012_010496 [Brassica carinata]|uniref:Uncharacterized protein n=1 Tax=Brassica carinata TaxID=52824 RepID=A0A8X7V421_BRACI|nr:hypothetical protein Bca52824_035413 [Brassica carinata]